MFNVVIIGGGVAGLSAAIKAKNKNNKVTILEKNSNCLKKLLLTGNGHCNYFNEDFTYKHYNSSNLDLVKEIINDENKNKLINFYNQIGIIPKIKNGYYYPQSNQAYSFYNALMKEAIELGVEFVNDTNVLKVTKNGRFEVETDKGIIEADKLIIATGSKAYPKTGSTGDGYLIAQNFNHTLSKVYPALVQVLCQDKYLKELDGVRSDVKVTLLKDNGIVKEEKGEIQFKETGLSGICIFNLSLWIDDFKNTDISVNLLDSLKINNQDEVLEFLDERSKKLINRNVSQILEQVLNYKIVNALLKKINIDRDIKFADLSEDEKHELASILVNWKFKVDGTNDYNNSQVCGGGIFLDEIDINTFESKLVKDLYFVGEILDITGECGGYNISLAVLSGIKAGESID